MAEPAENPAATCDENRNALQLQSSQKVAAAQHRSSRPRREPGRRLFPVINLRSRESIAELR